MYNCIRQVTKYNFSISVKYNFVYCDKLKNYGVRFSFQRTCFAQKLPICNNQNLKSCQYMKEIMSMKIAQATLHNTIIHVNNSSKGIKELSNACVYMGFSTRKFKTLIKTLHFFFQSYLFQQTLEYVDVVNIFIVDKSFWYIKLG